MKKYLLVIGFYFSTLVNAQLIDRGGGLIYDNVLDVTWLQDANYAKTSGYVTPGGRNVSVTSGGMTWTEAMEWAENLEYFDSVRNVTFSDWRLPTMGPVNGSHITVTVQTDGGTDGSYNVGAPGSVYAGSTTSELAYMFYTNLSNLSYYPAGDATWSNGPQPGYSYQQNSGPFVNLTDSFGVYIMNKTDGLPFSPPDAWGFNFHLGYQSGFNGNVKENFGWAVTDGDIAGEVTVPPEQSSIPTCGPGNIITDPELYIPLPVMSKPDLSVEYAEAKFSTCERRITDVVSLNEAFNYTHLGTTYSQLQPYNSTEKLALMNTNHIIDTETLEVVHKVNFEWPVEGQALRWSPVDSNTIYYISPGNHPDSAAPDCPIGHPKLMKYILSYDGTTYSGAKELIQCFTEYTSIDKIRSHEELSEDGRYIVLDGLTSNPIQHHVFSYDVLNKSKGATIDLPADATHAPDFVAISPTGNYVLIQYNILGMIAYNRTDMSHAGQVAMSTGHGDLVVDTNGTEYYIQTNSRNGHLFADAHYITRSRIPDGIIFENDGNGVEGIGRGIDGVDVDAAASIASGGTTPLLRLSWFSSAMHISCRSIHSPGWCVVGTYGKKNGDSHEIWENGGYVPSIVPEYPLEREIFRIYLDSTPDVPHVERLAHTRTNPPQCDYFSTPFAVPSPSGTKLMHNSAWNFASGDCTVDAYEMKLQ